MRRRSPPQASLSFSKAIAFTSHPQLFVQQQDITRLLFSCDRG
ncbi:hypothetical protein [Nostoc sp. JL23]|nr:hypothetical protein [Nostoc sp. JL23]